MSCQGADGYVCVFCFKESVICFHLGGVLQCSVYSIYCVDVLLSIDVYSYIVSDEV